MLSLSDILHDLRAAERSADELRRKLHSVERAGNPTRIAAGRLAMAERRVVMLGGRRLAILAAVDKLAGQITMLACAGLDHDAEEMQRIERRVLDMLGCEPLDADRWPYAAAALRAREWPEDVDAFVAFVWARRVLLGGERRAA